jgi:DNA polymerase III subunit delta'
MVGIDAALPMPWLTDWLASALQHQRGHAVLIHGPQGIGQWELSLSLAQAWLCEGRGRPSPCGRCASCRLVQARSHPDLLVLLPEALQAGLGWLAGGDDEAGEGAGAKVRQPSKDIKVDAVRAAVAFAQTTPARGTAKVVVLHPAERMNAVAANALLKTLEEPAGAARFILSSAAPDALLPTIRSRCQAMALAVPDPQVALPWLAGQGIADAAILLSAAGGQPLDALDWAKQGLDAAQWTRLPALVARGDAGVLAGWPVPRAVDALQKICHDAYGASVDAPPRYFPPGSLPAQAQADALLAWSRALARAARHADHPLNAGLLIESLVAQGRRALR